MRSKQACPICGQYNMDFYAITYRSHPFIDGKTYPRMCFGCAHVPEEYQQKYDSKGEIAEELGPFFDCKHLATAQELYQQGSVESLSEAQKCVAGVRQKVKEAGGATKLKKLKLKRPQHDYATEDGDEEKPKKKRVSKKVAPKGPKKKAAPKKKVKKKGVAKFDSTGKPIKFGAKKKKSP